MRSGAVQVGPESRPRARCPGLDAAAQAGTAPLKVDPVAGSGAEVLMFNLCADGRRVMRQPRRARERGHRGRRPFAGPSSWASTARRSSRPSRPGMTTVPARLVDEPRRELSRAAQTCRPPRIDLDGGERDARHRRRHPQRQMRRRARRSGLSAPFKDGTCLVVNIGTTSDDPVRVTIEIDGQRRSGQDRHQRTGAVHAERALRHVLRLASPTVARSRLTRSTWRSTPSGSASPASPTRTRRPGTATAAAPARARTRSRRARTSERA